MLVLVLKPRRLLHWAGSNSCADTPGWHDADGYTCADYAPDGICATYGDYFAGVQGQTANQACCTCQTCTDTPGWHDADGYTCADYAPDGICATYGDYFAGVQGQTANQACCTCGVWGQVPSLPCTFTSPSDCADSTGSCRCHTLRTQYARHET